jgi:hypothetical protein
MTTEIRFTKQVVGVSRIGVGSLFLPQKDWFRQQKNASDHLPAKDATAAPVKPQNAIMKRECKRISLSRSTRLASADSAASLARQNYI